MHFGRVFFLTSRPGQAPPTVGAGHEVDQAGLVGRLDGLSFVEFVKFVGVQVMHGNAHFPAGVQV
jgi:hypothetical protein